MPATFRLFTGRGGGSNFVNPAQVGSRMYHGFPLPFRDFQFAEIPFESRIYSKIY